MDTIDLSELEHVVGGAGFVDRVRSAASTTWTGVKDFSGGFVSGAAGLGPDGQLWGNSSSRASKAGGELGEFASSGFTPARIPRLR